MTLVSGQMSAVESMPNEPRPTQACLDVAPRFMNVRQSKPVRTIPTPTPAKTDLPVMTFDGMIRGYHIQLTMRRVDGYVDGGNTELAGDKLN
jgi:hypothetical protein